VFIPVLYKSLQKLLLKVEVEKWLLPCKEREGCTLYIRIALMSLYFRVTALMRKIIDILDQTHVRLVNCVLHMD